MSLIEVRPGVKVACKQCRICRSNRVDDLVGRCLAEQRSSRQTLALTLTYADDPVASSVLVYRDVQLMLKHLRNDGYDPRYICVGEHGTRKNRAHWHIILFLRKKRIELPLNKRVYDWEYWPHGLVYTQSPDYGGFRYCLKYVLKQERQETYTHNIRMSKYPPLGYEFFMDMAREMVDRGLAFHDPSYSFADVRYFDKAQRKYFVKEFWLRGRMRELMCERYVRLWEDRYEKFPPDTEFLMEKYFDPIARREMQGDFSDLEHNIGLHREVAIEAFIANQGKVRVQSDDLAFLMMPAPYELAVLFRDGRVHLHGKDRDLWLLDVTSGSAALKRQLEQCGVPHRLGWSLSEWCEARWKASRSE